MQKLNLEVTVIAGENDRGKSTVGKLLYSIIKSIGRYEKDLEIGEMVKLNEIIKRINEYKISYELFL